ncbi:hypothetical protein IV53_GL000537 [Ligilactobacillus ceti DSM 22408]|uniref:Rhodanese domain-containing protein n=1 Tax=Ligilactobacillus ceti DSM 22408 TaxID=1122146 RepID=A0A0R2KN96_9LACO|nr:hypothetical protein IV53_GL000537 [Ligilactobacillus ceti DSM 22408]
MGVIGWINVILVIGILYYGGTRLYVHMMGRRYAQLLENDEFRKGMHKAQLIDVREPNYFDESHILGARNVPYSQYKLYKDALRKDMPVYIYDQGKTLSVRMATKLHKAGYTDIVILKHGFSKWDGKTKSKK